MKFLFMILMLTMPIKVFARSNQYTIYNIKKDLDETLAEDINHKIFKCFKNNTKNCSFDLSTERSAKTKDYLSLKTNLKPKFQNETMSVNLDSQLSCKQTFSAIKDFSINNQVRESVFSDYRKEIRPVITELELYKICALEQTVEIDIIGSYDEPNHPAIGGTHGLSLKKYLNYQKVLEVFKYKLNSCKLNRSLEITFVSPERNWIGSYKEKTETIPSTFNCSI